MEAAALVVGRRVACALVARISQESVCKECVWDVRRLMQGLLIGNASELYGASAASASPASVAHLVGISDTSHAFRHAAERSALAHREACRLRLRFRRLVAGQSEERWQKRRGRQEQHGSFICECGCSRSTLSCSVHRRVHMFQLEEPKGARLL